MRLLEELLVDFYFVADPQVVRHFDHDNPVVQSFRTLVVDEVDVLSLVGV